jgi:filamentous hemagglutinin
MCKSITYCLVPAFTKAQIVADPNAAANQRATVLQTANAIPQINIQTPSSSGISRNSYSQFDVQHAGVILNNARTATQTQLGGWYKAIRG